MIMIKVDKVDKADGHFSRSVSFPPAAGGPDPDQFREAL